MSMIRHDNPHLPPFRGEVLPWIGGHLQTLKSTILQNIPPLNQDGEMLTIPLDDGDALTAMLHYPKNPQGSKKPWGLKDSQGEKEPQAVMIIIHGLTGCMDSHHVLQMADAALTQNYAVLRVNMRGAGASAPLSRKRYSAQSGADLLPFIRMMENRFPDLPQIMVAHSIGGAAALNMMVDHGDALGRLQGLATVAAPLDLHDASQRFHRFSNRPYVIYMLNRLKEMAMAMPDVTASQISQISKTTTIRQFDDLMTAPMMGFQNADAYYTAGSTHLKLDHPSRPLLLIHGDNDPLVGDAALRALPLQKDRHVLISRGGGHVGFHDDQGLWLPRVILAWAKQVLDKN